ncbi:hypothetical protein AMAG_09495 [Allomyces macrogynus ATCC 38327]|uniref:Uncharacterized protein n=1 Tax=Allomyces macrogynus (strain ATCC 38327) TaxID=578462 RepID=A0A0L0SQ34_ALLM3|nr:hypothetical protein AMAG_09495 [Allomyces macrogynus ATCC 38327]|eukprot:KNE64479.1 hypothetical protein AMAG_09495 [Allomyces macrogynus ATCC 38327]
MTVGTVENKVCLITGGGSGYGEALANRLFDEGAKLVIADINEEAAQAVAAKFNTEDEEPRAIALRTDVTKVEDLRAAFELTIETFGRVDVVVNNAGVSDGRFDEDVEMKWKRVLDIDLVAVIVGTQLALQYMAPHGGVVVNTASIAGIVSLPFAPIYAASKHGVLGFTKSMGLFGKKHGVRVNAVAPYFSDTPLVQRAREQNAMMEALLASKTLVPVDWVVDAMMQCITDEDLHSETIAVLPEVGLRKVPHDHGEIPVIPDTED